MKHVNGLCLRAICLTILCTGLLCGCAPGVVPVRSTRVGAAPLAGVAIDPDTGVRKVVVNPCSDEETAQAAAALLEAGAFTREELDGLDWDSPVSRAMFIRLTVGAFGAPIPAQEHFETWYAPYVKAGYVAGLFADSTEDMSFTPTDGFRMGDRSYAEMEQPIIRYDAAAILAHALPAGEGAEPAPADLDPELPALLQREVRLAAATGLIPLLEDGGFYGESHISVGQALVCAYRMMREGRRSAIGQTEETLPVGQVLQQQGRIVHAGGEIVRADGTKVSYTNSAEALVNAYRAGNRVIEFDLLQTADGHLACIHNWRSSYAPQITDNVPLTLAQWLQADPLQEFTPLCLESLADFMRQHPDLYVVTDVKDDNAAAAGIIAAACPDLLDRFVIQIYNDGEYEAVRRAGFSNIIYTLYNLSRAKKADTDHWTEFAAGHTLVGYAYPLEWFEMENYTEEMRKTGAPLFVHTVNGDEETRGCYEAGITAVYTDNITWGD